MKSQTVIAGATVTTTAVASINPAIGLGEPISYQFSIAGTGAISCNLDIETSNDGTLWDTNFNHGILSGTTAATEIAVFALYAAYVRFKVHSHDGTNCAATITIAY